MTSLFRRLRDIFGAGRPDASGARLEIFLDDEPSETEVLPASMAGWCAGEFAAIAESSTRNSLQGGTGWSEVHVRPPAPRSIAKLAIPFAPAAEALGRRLPRFDAVLAGSTSDPVPAKGAVAFGPSPLAAVVLTGSGTVEMLEVYLRTGGAEARVVLGALHLVPSPEPLVMVDWSRRDLVMLDDAADIERYLRPFDRA